MPAGKASAYDLGRPDETEYQPERPQKATAKASATSVVACLAGLDLSGATAWTADAKLSCSATRDLFTPLLFQSLKACSSLQLFFDTELL